MLSASVGPSFVIRSPDLPRVPSSLRTGARLLQSCSAAAANNGRRRESQ